MAIDRKEYFEEHLYYEIWMLNETYKLLDLPTTAISNTVVGNALIESFCCHARILIEFFKKERGADHYTMAPYKRSDKYEKLNRKINNQISHVVDEGRSDEIGAKIGHADRKMLIDLLGVDVATFKQNLRPPYDQWRKLPDVLSSNSPSVATIPTPIAPYGASSSPSTGTVAVNFSGPGLTTNAPNLVITIDSARAPNK